MKTILKYFLIIMILFAAGCSKGIRSSQENRLTITGSGKLTSQDVVVSEFDRVKADLPFTITIQQGDAFSVAVSSDDNFIDHILVEQTGRTIRFDYRPGYAYDISRVSLQATVTLPELKGISLSGSSHVLLKDLASTENLTAELSGSSILEGSIKAYTVDLNVNGSAYVSLAGSGGSLQVASCGNSLVDLSIYRVENATIDAGCISKVIVNATGKLEINASGNSQALYVTNPASLDITTHQFAQTGLK